MLRRATSIRSAISVRCRPIADVGAGVGEVGAVNCFGKARRYRPMATSLDPWSNANLVVGGLLGLRPEIERELLSGF